MTTTISGTTGIVFPAGGTGDTTGIVVGTTDTQTLTNKTLTSPTLTGGTLTSPTLTNSTITNYVETLQSVGTVGSTSTLSLTTGTVLTATLTASTPCTFTMPTPTAGKSFVLILTQAASGMTTATFTGVEWPGGIAPTITATASAVDILSFIADGSYWYGSSAQAFS
jgi:hypothetical protein